MKDKFFDSVVKVKHEHKAFHLFRRRYKRSENSEVVIPTY